MLRPLYHRGRVLQVPSNSRKFYRTEPRIFKAHICVKPEEEVDADEKGPYILQSEVEKAIKEMRNKKTIGDDDVHSVQQTSSGLIFRTSRSDSHVTYSCHHNSSRF
jgi:hypothetical protein